MAKDTSLNSIQTVLLNKAFPKNKEPWALCDMCGKELDHKSIFKVENARSLLGHHIVWTCSKNCAMAVILTQKCAK